MCCPIVGNRMFVGLINKTNQVHMEQTALLFLSQKKITNQLAITIHAQGFFVEFATFEDTKAAVDRCEDSFLHAAVSGKVSARLVSSTEEDSAVLRMEREVWIYPEGSSKNRETIADEIVNLVRHWESTKMCNVTEESGVTYNENLCTLIEEFPARDGRNLKYVVYMASSEHAVCAADSQIPDQFCLKSQFRVVVSTACEHRHRYDLMSVVIHLPAAGKVIFNDEEFASWAETLEDVQIQRLRSKVKSPKARQIFTEDFGQQRALKIGVERKRFYRSSPIAALPWTDYLIYQYVYPLMPEKEKAELELAIVGDPALLKNLHMEKDLEEVPYQEHIEEDNVAGDSFYMDIANSVLLEIPFSVFRPKDAANSSAKIKFIDVFMKTEGYQQSALKRTETIRKFEPELHRIISATDACGGLILNNYLPFDSLGGIVFYLWFDYIGPVQALVTEVKNKHIYITDIIQQTFGARLATAVEVGRGFYASFATKATSVHMDLVVISKEIINRYY